MSDKFGWEKAARKDASKRGMRDDRIRTKKNEKANRGKPGGTVFPFGKHNGQPLKHIPKSYLWWVLYHCQGLDTELIRDIIKVAGNGLKYARERGWATPAINPPDNEQPPRPSEKVLGNDNKEERWEYVLAVPDYCQPPPDPTPPRLSQEEP